MPIDESLTELLQERGFEGKPNEYMMWLTLKHPELSNNERVEMLRAFCHKDHAAALVLLDQMLDEISTRLERH